MDLPPLQPQHNPPFRVLAPAGTPPHHTACPRTAGSKGLTSAQVQERLVKYGRNMLTPPKEVPEIIKFLKQLANPLMALLLVAGALTYMAYGLQSAHDTVGRPHQHACPHLNIQRSGHSGWSGAGAGLDGARAASG